MPIQISCPACRRPLRVPDDLIGSTVKCPSCAEVFQAAVEERHDAPANREDQESRDTSHRYRDELPVPPRRTSCDELDDDDEFDEPPPRRFRRDLPPHRGSLIMALGLIAFFLTWTIGLGFVTGIPAWVMGASDLRKIRAGLMDPRGESVTNTGRILGMIATILNLIGCFCGILWVAFVIALDK